MTIREILAELSEFSPELFQGNERLEADRMADPWLSYYDAEAVFVADDFPLNMPAFKNAGTVIVRPDAFRVEPDRQCHHCRRGVS